MSLDKALDELMDGDIIVFQKYVLLEGFYHFSLTSIIFLSPVTANKMASRPRVPFCLKYLRMLTEVAVSGFGD